MKIPPVNVTPTILLIIALCIVAFILGYTAGKRGRVATIFIILAMIAGIIAYILGGQIGL